MKQESKTWASPASCLHSIMNGLQIWIHFTISWSPSGGLIFCCWTFPSTSSRYMLLLSGLIYPKNLNEWHLKPLWCCHIHWEIIFWQVESIQRNSWFWKFTFFLAKTSFCGEWNLKFEPNSHRCWQICENLAQIPQILSGDFGWRVVLNHKHPSAESGIWNLAFKHNTPLRSQRQPANCDGFSIHNRQ